MIKYIRTILGKLLIFIARGASRRRPRPNWNDEIKQRRVGDLGDYDIHRRDAREQKGRTARSPLFALANEGAT